jgi:hypothetical protein
VAANHFIRKTISQGGGSEIGNGEFGTVYFGGRVGGIMVCSRLPSFRFLPWLFIFHFTSFFPSLTLFLDFLP